MKQKKATRVNIPCRISYAKIWEPNYNEDGSKGKYSVALLIDKNDDKTVDAIKKAIEAAKVEGKSKIANSKGVVPGNIKTPLRDGDEKDIDDEAYAGKFFINASSKQKPQIVDRHVEPITEESEVYSGCYCNVSVNFYAFNVNTNKGIAAGLGNIQKVKDGERLAGGASANEDFEELEDDDEGFLD